MIERFAVYNPLGPQPHTLQVPRLGFHFGNGFGFTYTPSDDSSFGEGTSSAVPLLANHR